eukprot:UN24985
MALHLPAKDNKISIFNSNESKAPWVYLISTKAGSLGVNLHSSSRVIVFDCSWNPSHDSQAIFRCYRQGQKKEVAIYRLVSAGTMEQKIYQRQMVKQGLSLRVVDEKQIDRLFDKQEVAQLYQLEEDQCEDNGVLEIKDKKAKDPLIIDLLKNYGSPQALELIINPPKKCSKQIWIKDVDIPQDLLEHNEGEELTVQQRETAEQNFENDVRRETGALPEFPSEFMFARRGAVDKSVMEWESPPEQYTERVQCPICTSQTEINIDRQTEENTRFTCKVCHEVFRLTIDDSIKKRMKHKLQQKADENKKERDMYEEILTSNNSSILQEFHSCWMNKENKIQEQMEAKCPACGK